MTCSVGVSGVVRAGPHGRHRLVRCARCSAPVEKSKAPPRQPGAAELGGRVREGSGQRPGCLTRACPPSALRLAGPRLGPSSGTIRRSRSTTGCCVLRESPHLRCHAGGSQPPSCWRPRAGRPVTAIARRVPGAQRDLVRGAHLDMESLTLVHGASPVADDVPMLLCSLRKATLGSRWTWAEHGPRSPGTRGAVTVSRRRQSVER